MTHEFSHDMWLDDRGAYPLETPLPTEGSMEEVLPPHDNQGNFTKPIPWFKPHHPHIYWAGEVRRHQQPKPVSDYRSQNERALDDMMGPVIRRHAEVYGTDAIKAAILRGHADLQASKRREAIHASMLANTAKRRFWLLWPRKGYKALKAWYQTKRSRLARWMGLTALVATLNPGQLPWLKIGAGFTALVMTVSALTFAWH
jgi:hypothetical protein